MVSFFMDTSMGELFEKGSNFIYRELKVIIMTTQTYALLYFALLILRNTEGVPVAEFQMDGFFSENSYMNYSIGLGSDNITDFTLCIRQKINYLRGASSYSISFSNEYSDNALTVSFSKPSLDAPITLWMCRYKYIRNECNFFNVGIKIHHEWHHSCFTYNRTDVANGKITSTMQLYYDGQLKHTASVVTPEKEYTNLTPAGSFVIGQEQDGILTGGFFDAQQAFSGEVSQVELWNGILSEEEIQRLANCEDSSIYPQNKVISWGSNWSNSEVTIKDVPLQQLCQKDVMVNQFIWLDTITYDKFSTMCTTVGARLPILNDSDESTGWSTKLHDEIIKRYEIIYKETGNKNCYVNGNNVIFWLGNKRSENAMWQNPYTSEILPDFKIDSTNELSCAYSFGPRLELASCQAKFPCGICELPPDKLLFLKGLCQEDIEGLYDVQYYVHGVYDGMPYFRGLSKSHVFFNASEERWILQSLLKPSKYIMTEIKRSDRIPIGTYNWLVATERGLCRLKEGAVTELTFTKCYPEKYTCNSGHCIALSDKCNTEIDCEDKSDEYNCAYLKLNQNYANELIPRDSRGEACVVYINASVLAFPAIETVALRFTSDLYLKMRWYDLRIDFRDLNNVTLLNALSNEDKSSIWAPKLTFTNALGPFQTLTDELTTAVLVLEGEPLPEDISLANEAMLFSGQDNSIFFTREYYQEYSCEFDLTYYPFDTQMCHMELEVQDKTDNYVILAQDGKGVEFLANRKLVEYEIQKEVLQIKSEQNVSKAYFKFVFRRRMEYHVTNTFMQTLILVIVGYLSFFFDIDNFTDRIMVVLTTMLVIATIMAAIQTDLPKTSYYKLIDWWLLFFFNILVLTMAFHTYVAKEVARARGQSLSLFGTSGKQGNHFGKKLKVAPLFKENEEDNLTRARHINKIGNIAFVCICMLFMLIFWITALFEYFRPPEEYID